MSGSTFTVARPRKVKLLNALAVALTLLITVAALVIAVNNINSYANPQACPIEALDWCQ